MTNKVLVPVDLSKRSELAIDLAISLVEAFDGELVLMSNVNLDEREALKDYAEAEHLTTAEAAEARLLALARQCAPNISSSVIVRFHSSAADGILHAVDDVKADSIVMASHGRSGMSRWMLGSVAEKVVRHANVPVTIVPARDL